MVVQHLGAVWRPKDVQKAMGPKTLFAMGAQTVPNFLIIRMKYWKNSIPVSVWLPWWVPRLHVAWGSSHHWNGNDIL